MLAYEQALKQQKMWGFREGSMHFEKESAVHKSLQRIVRRLDELQIPYAVAGAMAMFFHGYQRFTTDVDLLVTPGDLKKIHDSLEGLGYVPPFQGSKQLRDAETGVRIEFHTTNDGKPKPVAIPDPVEAGVAIEGIQFLKLPVLIELKLASGMTNPGRLKDLGDVQELIRALSLPMGFADNLNPFVQDKYRELCGAVRDNPQE
jgi:hypothetical protein